MSSAFAGDTSRIVQSLWPRALGLTLLGTISGAISAAGITAYSPPDSLRLLLIFFLPGLVFGLIIGPALAFRGWLTPKRVPIWVVFAMLGHFAAAMCCTALTWRFEAALPITEESAALIAAALAGTLGGGVLAGGNRLLVPGAKWIAPTIIGGALGLLVALHDLGPFLGRLTFYAIWQAGYAAALGIALPARVAGATAT
jgi:hypothetical protein